MFRCILIIFRELQNISKAYIMFSNSLKIIKIDRKLSELRQIGRKKYNFNISAFVGFILWNTAMFEWWKTVHALIADSWNISTLFVFSYYFVCTTDLMNSVKHTLCTHIPWILWNTHCTHIPWILCNTFCMHNTSDEVYDTHTLYAYPMNYVKHILYAQPIC
jgi:hypothetical protein